MIKSILLESTYLTRVQVVRQRRAAQKPQNHQQPKMHRKFVSSNSTEADMRRASAADWKRAARAYKRRQTLRKQGIDPGPATGLLARIENVEQIYANGGALRAN